MLEHTNRSNFKTVLPVCILGIIALMIATMAVSFSKIESISKQMAQANTTHSVNTGLLRTMTEASLNRSLSLLEMIKSDNPIERQKLYLHVNHLAALFSLARIKLLEKNLSDRQLFWLKKQSAISQTNIPLEHTMYDYLMQDRYEDAKDIFYRQTVENRYININILEKISNLQNKIGQKKFLELKALTKRTLNTIIIAAFLTVAICILLTFVIMRFQKSNDVKLTKIANTDVLTGLPNRATLIHDIDYIIKNHPEKPFALIFFDIDYFKSINDNYGHDLGDEILKAFSIKISNAISPIDTLSRFGGDEFVLLLRNINSKEQAVNIISQISKMLDTSFIFGDQEIFTTSSMGATIYTPKRKSKDAKTLLSQADNAMYLAKDSGRNCFRLFTKETHDKMKREHAIEHELHSIIQNNNPDNKIFIEYQPLYNLDNLKVTGFEALIRWKNDEGEMVSPNDFIPIAEKTNLIKKINSYVIREVCRQKSEWNKSEVSPSVRINFNLSGNKSSICELLNEFKYQVEYYNLQYSDFGIELKEGTILDVKEETASEMKRLTKKGLKILIDDFGTGYSSLSYLKKLPITTLKIDKSFIAGLPHDNNDKELVKTIIALGTSFNLDIIAEGVETSEQLSYLKDHSCFLGQGYYLDKPLSINDVNAIKLSDYCA